MRKQTVKTSLTSKQIALMDKMCDLLGEDRAGVLRAAFLSYAKEIGALQHYLVENSGVSN